LSQVAIQRLTWTATSVTIQDLQKTSGSEQVMAKNERGREGGKVKFRVIEFEMEGADSTLVEGIRNMLQSRSAMPVKKLKSPGQSPEHGKGNGANGASESDIIDAAEDQELEQEVLDADGDDEHENAPSPKPKQQRRPTPVKILEDLDLKVATPNPPFREYCAGKKVESDRDRYILVAHWLKKNLKLDEITGDHIYTCLSAVKWAVPTDITGPFRGMKKPGYFVKGSAKGAWKLTHVADNVIAGL
jgi:hypothetical protein